MIDAKTEDVRLIMAKEYIKDNIELNLKVGDVASYCGGTVLIMKGSEYTEDIARHCVDGLDTNGCSVLGVVIDE